MVLVLRRLNPLRRSDIEAVQARFITEVESSAEFPRVARSDRLSNSAEAYPSSSRLPSSFANMTACNSSPTAITFWQLRITWRRSTKLREDALNRVQKTGMASPPGGATLRGFALPGPQWRPARMTGILAYCVLALPGKRRQQHMPGTSELKKARQSKGQPLVHSVVMLRFLISPTNWYWGP
jgi:hypothetical protein